ncbi:MAG: hypothetical protein ACXABY_00770 [Candidatus Thorarchaeota archaeon]|jgi:hypothetical protein
MWDRRTKLVQRLEARKFPGKKKGVDHYFLMDYMGSAEFEFGALPYSLDLMRASDKIDLWEAPTRIDCVGHALWFVGACSDLETAIDLVVRCLDGTYEGKERPYMRQALEGEDDYFKRFVGWWVINQKPLYGGLKEKVPFCVFASKEYAEQWLQGMRENKE